MSGGIEPTNAQIMNAILKLQASRNDIKNMKDMIRQLEVANERLSQDKIRLSQQLDSVIKEKIALQDQVYTLKQKLNIERGADG